jgi:hypothetical protein
VMYRRQCARFSRRMALWYLFRALRIAVQLGSAGSSSRSRGGLGCIPCGAQSSPCSTSDATAVMGVRGGVLLDAREGFSVLVHIPAGGEWQLEQGVCGQVHLQLGGEFLPVRVTEVASQRDLAVGDGDVEGGVDGGVVRAVGGWRI